MSIIVHFFCYIFAPSEINIPSDPQNMTRRNYNDIQISNGRNVRYHGEALDKCGIASLIHDVAFDAGNHSWPLWSDIYWDSATKVELCNYLKEFLSKLI